jgi:hypothetical protein
MNQLLRFYIKYPIVYLNNVVIFLKSQVKYIQYIKAILISIYLAQIKLNSLTYFFGYLEVSSIEYKVT